MKKQRKKPQTKQRQPQQPAGTAAQSAPNTRQSRRNFLRLARNGAIALPVIGLGGFFTVQSVQASICEADLTKIGNGKPAIVQIHDPQCPMCQTLQRQTRRAMKGLDGDTFSYLVANINTDEGRALARSFNVPHVTLLLFDGQGEMVQIVRGPSDMPTLRAIFAGHLATYA